MKFGVPWAGGQRKDALARASTQSSADDLAALSKRLNRITQQFERTTRDAAMESSPTGAAPAGASSPDRAARTKPGFEQRLDRLTSDIPKTDNAASRAAESVARQRRESAPAPLTDDISAALNEAIAEISLRQQVLDAEAEAAAAEQRARKSTAAPASAPSATQLSGLERQLQQLTSQMESLNRPCNLDSAVAALRQDLAEIGHTLAEAMPRRAIEALEAEVRALSERIYESRHSGVDGSKLAGVEQGLAEVRDALRALTPSESLVGFDEAVRGLAEKVDQIASTSQDPAALEQVQTAIPSLRGIVARVASDEALKKLTDEVRELSGRVERIADANANSGFEALSTIMEQRIAKLTDVVAARSESKPMLPPQLETVISALSDKLEQMHLSRGDQVAMGHLEDRIAQLVEKLDSSDSRLDHLAAIERGLADLLVRLEELRAAGAIRPLDSAVSLERDLADIKEAQSLSERRTQETFEAVQGTLGEVVERLATIETDLHSAPEAGSAPADKKPKTTFRSLLGSVTSGSHPARPIDPSLPPDHPLEPGIGPLRERAGADQMFGAESDGGAGTGESEKPSVISAARRALRANTGENGATTESRREKPRGLVAGLRAQGTSQNIRSLLVGVSVVVIVLATAHMAINMFWPDRADIPGLNRQNLENGNAPDARGAGSRNAPATTNTIPDRRSALPSPIPPSGVMIPEEPGRVTGPAFNPSTVLGPQADAGVTGSIPLQAPASRSTGGATPRDTTADKVPAAIASPALRLAAANGDPSAEYEVGIRFAEGRGVAQNFEEAVRWLDRAARAGIVPAQFRLGSLYEKGLGSKKDIEAARKLYVAAAEKGHAKAMHNLAVLYAEGIEGKPDYKTAAQWFSRAANHGVADSQYNLGILYARGIGVEQNLAESYKWFTLAAGQGDQDAAKKRDDVATKLDAQALMAARLAAQTWTATPQPEAAANVKIPTGGWDKPVSTLQPAKPKPRVPAAPKVELL
jgi:localization factor PodJL